MTDKKFSLPPISPLLGSSFLNYVKILRGNRVVAKFYLKVLLTAFVILITTPFRWYDTLIFHSRLKKTKIQRPVFIIGHWRSGTTYLHNLLCQDPQNGFVATYQTVFPHFMASKKIFSLVMNKLMPKKRPSDNVELAIDFPQEEEFGFLNTNPNSIYNLCYFPKNYKLYYDRSVHGDGMNKQEIAAVKFDYDQLLKKALIASGKKRLVIKNPINTARLPFLTTAYPDARFIHIVRNPYIVYLSTKKFFGSLLPTMWFHEVSKEAINTMVIALYVRLHDDFFDQRELIEANCIEIKFEELEDSSLDVIRKIYQDIEIEGLEKALPHIESYIKEQKKYEKNNYKISRTEVELINKHWGKYIAHWDYTVPKNLEIIDD